MTDQEAKPKHRLAAIMATDVVGYSKLMQSDETAALAALSALRNATQEHIELHQGRIANTAGDSVLAEFGSAVEAVSCAMALQEELLKHSQGKISRSELASISEMWSIRVATCSGRQSMLPLVWRALPQPGGIVVSAAVRDAIAGKLPASFTDLGLKTLKNIEGPVRAYSLSRLAPARAVAGWPSPP